jgi:hypothetical protein
VSTSNAQRLALELASAILDEIDERSRKGIRGPLSAEDNAHIVGLIAERHNLRPAQIKAMFRQIPWAMRETQRMADAAVKCRTRWCGTRC